MSNQLQITGDLKVKSLTGALTATAGVVTSVPLGTANGVATLGADGKVPSAQLPTLASSYKGTWNASTNTPYIVDGVGTAGDYYLVSVGGTWNGIVFLEGNTVIYSGTIWQKAGGGSGTVTSVGLSAPAAFSITGSPITGAGTLAIAGAGASTEYIKGDGTLGLFSTAAISAVSGTYLPLAGGTLTGNITLNTASGNPTLSIQGQAAAYSSVISMNAAGAGSNKIFASGGSNNFYLNVNDNDALYIAPSGAATFSNSVTSTNAGGTFFNATNTAGGYAKLEVSSNATSNATLSFTNSLSITGGATSFVYRNNVSEIMDLQLSTEAANSKSKLSLLWYGNETASIKFKRGGDATGGSLEFWTQADTLSTTQKMTILGNGNVGIGTSSPSSGISSTETTLQIENGNVAALSLNNSTSRKYSIYSGVGGQLGFYDVTADTERMRITSGGLVGIGTSSPSFSSTGTGLNVQTASGDSAYLKVNYSGGNSAEFRTGFAIAGIGNVSNNPFQIFTNNTEKLRITNGGNILIGTNGVDNGAKLQVNGSATFSDALNINLSGGSGFNVASDSVIFRSNTGVGTPRQVAISIGGGSTTTLEAKGYGANYITDFNIKTYNSAGTSFDVFYGTSAGNVGINNNSPAYKLDVNGTGRFTNSLRIEGAFGIIVNATDPSLYFNNIAVQWRSYLKTSNNNIAFNDSIRDVLTLGYNGSASFFQGGNVLINSNVDNGQGKLQVNGNIYVSGIAAAGNTYDVSSTLSTTYYHIINTPTGSGQTFTLPSPTSNNLQYVIVNKSAFSQTISAGSGFTIYDMAGDNSATITLASEARCFIIADGSSFYQIF